MSNTVVSYFMDVDVRTAKRCNQPRKMMSAGSCDLTGGMEDNKYAQVNRLEVRLSRNRKKVEGEELNLPLQKVLTRNLVYDMLKGSNGTARKTVCAEEAVNVVGIYVMALKWLASECLLCNRCVGSL